MKKFIPFIIAILFVEYSAAQINTGVIKTAPLKTAKIIPATKASLIRKDVVNLKLQLTQLNDSIGITKKAIDEEVKKMADKLDSMSEMGEMESLRLQMAMDRLSKMMTTLSNLLKKINDTAQGITQNIK